MHNVCIIECHYMSIVKNIFSSTRVREDFIQLLTQRKYSAISVVSEFEFSRAITFTYHSACCTIIALALDDPGKLICH